MHEYGNEPSLTAGFVTLPSTAFTVIGAGLPRDALLISAGPTGGWSTAGASTLSLTLLRWILPYHEREAQFRFWPIADLFELLVDIPAWK